MRRISFKRIIFAKVIFINVLQIFFINSQNENELESLFNRHCYVSFTSFKSQSIENKEVLKPFVEKLIKKKLLKFFF
jgi:hypothetical protein